jgi:glutaredoxin
LGLTRELLLYTRDACGLCKRARELLLELLDERPGLELREVDIDADDALLAAYLERIPVVEVGGEVIAELVVDPHELRRRLDTLLR